MNNFSNRLQIAMDSRGLNGAELSRRTGIARSSISDWLNNKYEAKQNNISILAKTLNVDEGWLLGLDTSMERKHEILTVYNSLTDHRQEKVYQFAEHQLEQQKLEEDSELYVVGQTAAGAPIEGQQAVPFVGGKTVSLIVNGDSMEPAFYDGDVITYKPQPTLENGEIGVFTLNGGITLKRFKNNGDIRLQSLNEKYEDIVVKEGDEFSILGKAMDKKKKSYE